MDQHSPKAFFRNCIQLAQGNELTLLANLYGSDKGNYWPNQHDYCSIYQDLFAPFREEGGLNILEIGLCQDRWGGQRDVPSLRMWLDYFPNARVFGFDKSDFSFFRNDRCRIFVGDQGSRCDLNHLAENIGCDIDIVIDDGSHISQHQQLSMGVLFQKVKPGGLYIIEDLDWQPPGSAQVDFKKTREVLVDFLDCGRFISNVLTEAEMQYVEGHISAVDTYGPNNARESINFKLAIIRKMGVER